MKKVYLGLGSNTGNREEFLKRSLDLLGERCGLISARSAVYETSPVGFTADRDFLNMVVLLETGLRPSELMGHIHDIEAELGRVREGTGYTSRTIDIDILLYGDDVIDESVVKIPHPRMHERRFVLEPLNEIAPDLIHPVLKKSVWQMLHSCSKMYVVRKTFLTAWDSKD